MADISGNMDAPWWVVINGSIFYSGNDSEEHAIEIAQKLNAYNKEGIAYSVIQKPVVVEPEVVDVPQENLKEELIKIFGELQAGSKTELVSKFQEEVDFIDSDADKKAKIEKLFASLSEKYKVVILDELKGGK